MKKSGLLARLEQLRLQSEENPNSDLIALEIMALLTEYINDRQVEEAVDQILYA